MAKTEGCAFYKSKKILPGTAAAVDKGDSYVSQQQNYTHLFFKYFYGTDLQKPSRALEVDFSEIGRC